MGRVDFATFGLTSEDLSSLRVLAGAWSAAVDESFAGCASDAVLSAFAEQTKQLPASLNDVAWQDRWLRCWQRLYSQGVPGSSLFSAMNASLDHCTHGVFATAQLSRLQIALVSLLRRAVMAVLSCAVDLGEETRLLEAGVPDELAALRYLRQEIDRGEPLAVLSISVVNREAFAHLSAGDRASLPGLVAGRIQKIARARDRLFTGREGEWLFVLPGIHSMAQPALAASNILREFSDPLTLPAGKRIHFDVEIGAAMVPEHATDAESVVAASRLARWGRLGTNQAFGWFHPNIQAEWSKRFELAAEFKMALDQGALEFFLQPQVDASSSRCVGAELLLRWRRRNGEWVSPQLLMEIVEENGWRHLFTDWALSNALRISSELAEAGCAVRLSLNLSADDLLDEDLVEMIVQRLETWQMSGERFTLELTESAMMVNRERCVATLLKLRALGFRLALDDFGTGYSSLSHLVSLPVDELKIDRSFIVAMAGSDEYRRIVRSIVDLAHDLGMTPLAEGVEAQEQVEQLLALGCRHIQGYFYARPIPQDEFISWSEKLSA